MHHEHEGAFTGEISAADARRGRTCRASCSAIPSGGELFGETDRALALKVPAALDAGLTPILCVGEIGVSATTRRPSASCATRSRRTSPACRDERLAEVVIAYEPIWAIGTGRVATPEQAQEAIAFIRALVGDRDEQARQQRADPLRRLGQARERRRAARAAGRRRRARRRRLAATPSRSPRSSSRQTRDEPPARRPGGCRVPTRLPGRARRLGPGRAGPGQRRLAGAHARVRRAVGHLPAHDARRPAAAPSGCRTARWATARSAT